MGVKSPDALHFFAAWTFELDIDRHAKADLGYNLTAQLLANGGAPGRLRGVRVNSVTIFHDAPELTPIESVRDLGVLSVSRLPTEFPVRRAETVMLGFTLSTPILPWRTPPPPPSSLHTFAYSPFQTSQCIPLAKGLRPSALSSRTGSSPLAPTDRASRTSCSLLQCGGVSWDRGF